MSTFGLSSADHWGEDENPRHYDAFARQYPMYQQTSRDLIALARPSSGDAVLDLACGTGVTTQEVLAVLGQDGKVIGVDKSAAMLARAAISIADPRVTWVQAPAESVDQHVSELVDTVVCNSAIWQTELVATAAAVRHVMAAGGRFAFNVGSGFLEQGDDPASRVLDSVMRAIAAQEHGWTLPRAGTPLRARPRLSRESIGLCLSKAGFEVEQVKEFKYEQSAESLRAWLSVPIFTERLLPGLPYKDRMRVLDKAYDRLGPGEAELARWVAFAAKASEIPEPT